MARFTTLLGGLAVFLSLAAGARAEEKKSGMSADYFVYYGTYTGPKSKGIYVSRFDSATGTLSPAELAAECKNPAFLARHPHGPFLYAIDEGSDPARNARDGLSAFSIDRASGKLTLLNQQTSGGPGPCHLAVDSTGSALLVANYSGGSSSIVGLQADGRLGPLGSVIKHSGSSVNPARQKEPHAHGIYPTANGAFALVPDLGLDQVLVYRLDAREAKLTPHVFPFARLAPGSGPRHLAFSPSGNYAYVINELFCTMTVFAFDQKKGELSEVQTVSTLPAGVSVKSDYSTAEVFVHASGKFVYGSNRGHNTIAVFKIEEATGKLTLVQNQSTLGKTPRNFVLDPTGKWLINGNQDSDTVTVFRIDPKTGQLTPHGQPLSVPSAVSMEFVASK